MQLRSRSLVAAGLMMLGSSSLAAAADLPARMPVKAPAAVTTAVNWTGGHIGGHVGGAWVTQNATFLSTTGGALDPAGTVYNTDHSGVLGGVQLGYDYQIRNWVVGIGGDFSWTGSSADTVTNGALFAGSVIHTRSRTDWLATVTGRVGYAFDNWLVYGKGGVAFAREVYGGYAIAGGVTTTYDDLTVTRTGWTAGAGVEWAFARNWSVFVEYDYLDFGAKTYTLSAPAAGVTSDYDIKTQVSEAKFGVNWRF